MQCTSNSLLPPKKPSKRSHTWTIFPSSDSTVPPLGHLYSRNIGEWYEELWFTSSFFNTLALLTIRNFFTIPWLLQLSFSFSSATSWSNAAISIIKTIFHLLAQIKKSPFYVPRFQYWYQHAHSHLSKTMFYKSNCFLNFFFFLSFYLHPVT